jgi:hypothetical protein
MKTYTLPQHIVKDSKEELAFLREEFIKLKTIPNDQVTEDDEAYAFYIGNRVADFL